MTYHVASRGNSPANHYGSHVLLQVMDLVGGPLTCRLCCARIKRHKKTCDSPVNETWEHPLRACLNPIRSLGRTTLKQTPEYLIIVPAYETNTLL